MWLRPLHRAPFGELGPRDCPHLPERPLCLRPARVCLCSPGSPLPFGASFCSSSFLLGSWGKERMTWTGSWGGTLGLSAADSNGTRARGWSWQTRAETEQEDEDSWLFEQVESLRAKNGRIGTGGLGIRFFKIYFY